MNGKPGSSKHDRKFIVSRGSLYEPGTGRDHRDTGIVFWGEWEGPSVFWRIEGAPGKPKPSIIHAPFRPDSAPFGPVQNTDPLVFGDAFIYSNCLQHAYASLRRLAEGSIVLFGRHSREAYQPAFSLDTCLVVHRLEALEPLPFDPAGIRQRHSRRRRPEPSLHGGSCQRVRRLLRKDGNGGQGLAVQLLPRPPARRPEPSLRASATGAGRSAEGRDQLREHARDQVWNGKHSRARCDLGGGRPPGRGTRLRSRLPSGRTAFHRPRASPEQSRLKCRHLSLWTRLFWKERLDSSGITRGPDLA